MERKFTAITEPLYDYIYDTFVKETAIQKKCREETAQMPDHCMQIPFEQGQLLGFLVRLLEAKQIMLLAAKDSGYDLYGVGAWFPKLAVAGWVEPLAPYLQNSAFPSVDLNDFWPAGRDFYNWKGEQYGLPWKVNLGAILYIGRIYLTNSD